MTPRAQPILHWAYNSEYIFQSLTSDGDRELLLEITVEVTIRRLRYQPCKHDRLTVRLRQATCGSTYPPTCQRIILQDTEASNLVQY